MINGKRVIGIIPARSGSKGLPSKNLRILCGKPLIGWTVESGKASKYIDELIVSTDSEEIAEVARNFGATVPFIRPRALASDLSSTIDVIKHALTFYREKLQLEFEYTLLLEPTSPLRDTDDIDNALEELDSNPNATSLVGIALTEGQNPAFQVLLSDSGLIQRVQKQELQITRRQDINEVYFFEGSVYVSKTEDLEVNGSFVQNETIGMVFPKWKSLEIDDMDDFVMVEALMRHKAIQK